MIAHIGRLVGHTILNRAAMTNIVPAAAGIGAAAVAAPIGAKMRHRHILRHAASREAAAGVGAAALAAPVGAGAAAIVRRLRRRRTHRWGLNRTAVAGGLGVAAVVAGVGGKLLSRRRRHVDETVDFRAEDVENVKKPPC